MAFKVFISHSTSDKDLVDLLRAVLERIGIQTIVAMDELQPGNRLTSKVEKLMDESDCVVVLMTRHGTRSQWVQNEVGIAVGKEKPIVPLVEKGVQVGGILHDLEYIEFDRQNPNSAIVKTASFLQKLAAKKSQEENLLLGLGGLLIFLLLLGRAE